MHDKRDGILKVNPALRELFRAKETASIDQNGPRRRPLSERLSSVRGSSPCTTADLVDAHPLLEQNLSTLTRRQAMAIIFMSLPPEQSAQVFSGMDAKRVKDITQVIVDLPSIPAKLRSAVLTHLLFGISRKVINKNQEPSDELEKLIRLEPAMLSDYLITEYWGSQKAWLDFEDEPTCETDPH